MSAVKETRLWGWLAKTRPEFLYRLHMKRLENSVGSGTPDVEGCLDGAQFWIELKCAARPARETTKIKVKFRPAQRPWLSKRIKAGGNAFVLLQVGQGKMASRYLLWATNDHTKRLANGVTEKDLGWMVEVKPDASAADIIRAAAG